MSFTNRLYTGFKSLPLVGGLVERIRSKVYNYVVRVIDERQLAFVERDRELSERASQLSERIEFVRLELFYELMHKTKSMKYEASEQQEHTTLVLNQETFDKALASNQIRLNLGCGHKPVEGYLNVDQRALPHVDIQASILSLPFEPATVDEIYAAHLVEHFTMQSLRNEVLPYWLSLLKPNGVVRIVAPNAQAMIEAYAQQKMPFEQLTTVLLGMQEYEGDFHFAMLSPDNLTKLLQEVGFSDVEVIVRDRPNGMCYEMELTAKKSVLN